LLNDTYSTLMRTRTDGSGRYYFRALSQGRYKVRVLPGPTDFIEQTQDVEITNFNRQVPGGGNIISGFENVQLDFALQTQTNRAVTSAGAPGAVFVQEVPDEARKTYDAALADLANKREQQGLLGLKTSIEQFPNYYQALDRLGTEYVKRGYYEAAAILLTKAAEVNPRGFTTLYALGLAWYRLNQNSRAIDAFQRSVSLNPTSPNAHLWLGIVQRKAGQLEQAEKQLKQASEFGKGRIPVVHWQLALLYNQRKLYTEAANELETFLKLQPDSRDAEKIQKLIVQFRQKAVKS
jgi:tetratricopeptide (TPR) repeat protein